MSNCRDCGAPIIWGCDDNGKRVPLDLRPPVYRKVALDRVLMLWSVRRDPEACVLHQVVCPKARTTTTKAKPDPRAAAAGE